jgi:hypothetical protein
MVVQQDILLNIGSRDNFDWMSLKITEGTLDLGRDVSK